MKSSESIKLKDINEVVSSIRNLNFGQKVLKYKL